MPRAAGPHRLPVIAGRYNSTERHLPGGQQHNNRSEGRVILMTTILWILAVVLIVAGVFALIRKEMLWGAVLIIVGLLVGPGGVSIFS